VGLWQLAEQAGETTRMQRLLTTARWDADAPATTCAYIVEQLGDPGGVLVVDETGPSRSATGG
jgi:hypothetical protein